MLNNKINRLVPIDINAIFDIDKKSDINISNNELDNILNRIINATDSVKEDLNNIEKSKTFHLPVDSYEEWIKNLKKAGHVLLDMNIE
ncbi:6767_t:CDS:2 [Cetraspora pellucida]|uniref:6767_t:CDS:1 n=1 Tax=Cetraspora pellucida TaxID=1433469 RepID=A0A9N8VPT9_9GLOM|nr:6767_t:CDS:2 [Cetraspora pellucida]